MRAPSSWLLTMLPTLLVLTLASFVQFSQRGSVSSAQASGAVVPKAPVTRADLARNQTSTTSSNASGHDEFSPLLPADDQVSVELTGFKKSVSDRLPVSPQTLSAATFSSRWP